MRLYVLGYWLPWSVYLGWTLAGLIGSIFFVLVGTYIAGVHTIEKAPTPLTVETETPDHVVHLQNIQRASVPEVMKS